MANKRELKKYLKCVSGEVIEEALFISEYYDPAASAELVEPLSSETGLEIYRITG